MEEMELRTNGEIETEREDRQKSQQVIVDQLENICQQIEALNC